MVDTTRFAEGQNLTVQLVKDSPSKRCVIIGEAQAEETDFGEKLTVQAEIDGKQKKWRMNRDTVKNLRQLGVDSNTWGGAVVNLRIITVNGKESVVGVPELKAATTEKIK